jgi:hypothetical protein
VIHGCDEGIRLHRKRDKAYTTEASEADKMLWIAFPKIEEMGREDHKKGGSTMRKMVSFCIALMLSFTLIGLIGCGEDSEGEPEKSARGPSISTMVPENGAKDVPTTASVLIAFDKAVVTPSAASLVFTPAVTGDVSYDAVTSTLVFKPSTELSKYTDYSLKVHGVMDMEGNSMSPVTINFTTSIADTERPEVTSTFPEDGQKDVGHDTDIIIRFSEPLDRTKLRKGIAFAPRIDSDLDEWFFGWSTANDEEVTISPPAGIEPFEVNEEYTLVLLKSSVVDLSGNAMIADHQVTFRTLKYAVEKAANPAIASTMIDPSWMFTVGKRGGTWVVAWGGERPQGAPTGSSPGGTITASADGQISDDVETQATRKDQKVTYSVSKGNGNRLTFSSDDLDGKNSFRIIFGSSSSYLIFSLRPATAQYINIGTKSDHPSRSTFILPSK